MPDGGPWPGNGSDERLIPASGPALDAASRGARLLADAEEAAQKLDAPPPLAKRRSVVFAEAPPPPPQQQQRRASGGGDGAAAVAAATVARSPRPAPPRSASGSMRGGVPVPSPSEAGPRRRLRLSDFGAIDAAPSVRSSQDGSTVAGPHGASRFSLSGLPVGSAPTSSHLSTLGPRSRYGNPSSNPSLVQLDRQQSAGGRLARSSYAGAGVRRARCERLWFRAA